MQDAVCWHNHEYVWKVSSPQVNLQHWFHKNWFVSPGDTGKEKENMKVILLDFMDVTMEQVTEENHGGVGCVCTLCEKLKSLEDTWIMRLGTFFHPGGLNKRDEIKRKVRATY